MKDDAYYDSHPDGLETEVRDTRPGLVLLARSPFYPGGGGQLADKGVIRWARGETAIDGIEQMDGESWVRLADDTALVEGMVEAVVDANFRRMMCELHTGTHILNALVFAAFDGAIVTGAQLGADGTARIDFDLPNADSDRLRALEGPLSEVIRQDMPVSVYAVPMVEALGTHGLIRSKSVAPPPSASGEVRIVDIVGLDRQACGGTHLASTGESPPVRILKIDNKGKHNRRIRIGFV